MAAPPPTRDRLIDAGAELFRRQGYTGTGVKQILAEARAPFGSMYHHFPGGKAELGAEAVRRSGRLYALVVAEAMAGNAPLADRVESSFRQAAARMDESGWADACPIATVALEMSGSSELLRTACAEVFEEWFAGCTTMFAAGGVPEERASELAVQMLCALEGAFVFCRALQRPEPLHVAGAGIAAAVREAQAAGSVSSSSS